MLLGAILAPTDPVLATDVQIRHPGDRDQLRFTLTCEAGMNDGSAFPFVMLGLGLLGLHDLGDWGLKWLLVDAVWVPNYDTCHADGAGACWGVIAEKFRIIIFGRYPFAEQWRPLVACILLVCLLAASCYRGFWKLWLLAAWVVVLPIFFLLMHGGAAGLTTVETSMWGGFPLTLLLSTVSIVVAFPLAVLVAPACTTCTGTVMSRSVPLMVS